MLVSYVSALNAFCFFVCFIVEVVFPSTEADPASGAIVSGSGDLAPGIAAKVSIDFTPDSLGEYHDKLSVVTEAGTFEVCEVSQRLVLHYLQRRGGGCVAGDIRSAGSQ